MNLKRITTVDFEIAVPVITGVIVLSAVAYRYGTYIMLPDNFNYITYWQQLLERAFHTTALQTPKPLLILIFGSLWKVTGSLTFLIILFIGIGTVTLYACVRIVCRLCGPADGWLMLALLLPNEVFLRATLSGCSELLSAAGI